MTTKRQRLGRFFYVGSKRSRVLHLSKHQTEGYRTVCGVMIPARWFTPRTWLAKRYAARAPKCKKCLARAPQIVVQRVRKTARR